MSPTFVFRGADLLLSSVGRPFHVAPGLPAFSPDSLQARVSFPGPTGPVEALRLGPARPEGEAEAYPGLSWRPVRALLGELSEEDLRLVLKAQARLTWHEVSRHCGACGAGLVDDPAEGFTVGARRCPACDRVFYPRISPAVIVLVEREDRILLAHNASFPAGRFGLIAGFVEVGESLEETLRRELREEASVEVGEVSYVGSQPWPFPDSLMLAFRATWLSGEGKPDGREITEVRWCGPDDLPSIPPPGSVARRLIDGFLASRGSPPLAR